MTHGSHEDLPEGNYEHYVSEFIKELQPQHEILMTMNIIDCFVNATVLILFPSIHHTLKLFIVITSRVDLYEVLDQSSEKNPQNK